MPTNTIRPVQPRLELRDLFTKELKDLGIDRNVTVAIDPHGGQTMASQTYPHLCGLALSGGGIRSATFNLGVLQGLYGCSVLRYFHYLSAVSGGAYIAGWLTAGRSRNSGTFDTSLQDGVSNPAIRHLREFSKFLLPRIGLTEGETWLTLFTAIVSAIPTLLVALLVLLLSYSLWLAIAMLPMLPQAFSDSSFFLLTLSFLLLTGGTFKKLATMHWKSSVALTWHAILVSVVATTIYAILLKQATIPTIRMENISVIALLTDNERMVTFLWVAGLLPLTWSATALVWGGIGLLLSRQRVQPAIGPDQLTFRQALHPKHLRVDKDRITSRLLPASLHWAVLIAVWILIQSWWKGTWGFVGAIGVIPGYLCLFFWAWGATRGSRTKVLLGRPLESVMRILPQVLVYAMFLHGVCCAAIIYYWYLTAISASLLVVEYGQLVAVCLFPLTTLIALLVAAFCIDPHSISLHQWYRSRIARAFLSDPLFLGSMDRRADAQASDDTLLRDLPGGAPLLLVGCAANDQQGDPLRSLGRGADNATLSRNGLTVGSTWTSRPLKIANPLTLSDALAASGAAINSSMGAVTTRLGPAISFLMTAFNLRLGLWVTRWSARLGGGHWPGFLLLYELLARTSTSNHSRSVHLSDGGHFDNTGAYELVRRRCRYIVMTDCGEDEGFNFDDVGNFIRKVRQDFGVEIDIDLESVRPDAHRRARQAVAIGTIHYGSTDKGLLILLKPNLTGVEPQDVQQYAKRNTLFPHEATGDQFYDDAQWEAYRRLGMHVASLAFRPAMSAAQGVGHATDRAMQSVAREWTAPPLRMSDNFLELTERVHAFEAGMLRSAPAWLIRQVYSDLVHDAPVATITPEDLLDSAGVLVSFVQLMEDVWHGSDLARAPAHSLASGWMNYFRRWTRTEAVRTLWPLISPMYSLGFRRFAENAFDLPTTGEGLALESVDMAALASSYVFRESPFVGEVYMLPSASAVLGLVPVLGRRLPIAYCVHKLSQTGTLTIASWHASDCFVLPFLRNADWGTIFLNRLLEVLAVRHGTTVFRVRVSTAGLLGSLTPDQIPDVVEYYRALGFGPSEDPAEAEAGWLSRTDSVPGNARPPVASQEWPSKGSK